MNTGHAQNTATRLSSGKVLVAGGFFLIRGACFVDLASTELYDPATGEFAPAAQTATMNATRFGHTAILLSDGNVLIIGGTDGHTFRASTELYDTVSNSFAPRRDRHHEHS